MKRILAIGVLSSLGGLSVWAASQTLTGQISDSMCGKSHAGMGEMGKNPKECTMGCVKAGGKYVFVSGDKVYDIKTRSRHKPLSLLIGSTDQAEELAKPLPEEFYALTRKFWPGPLTIIVRAGSKLPLKVTANTGNVALRVPSAKIPLAVVTAAAIPITATSANLSGAAECTSAEQVRDQLQGRINIIVDGGTSPRDVASTIVDLSDETARWRIIREGAIPADEISKFFAQGQG